MGILLFLDGLSPWEKVIASALIPFVLSWPAIWKEIKDRKKPKPTSVPITPMIIRRRDHAIKQPGRTP